MPRTPTASQKFTIEERRTRVTQMFIEGFSQVAIAEECGVVQSTVSADIKAITEGWQQSRMRDFDEHQAEILAKYTYMEAELWEAWHKSKGEHVITTEKSGIGSKGAYTETAEKKEERVGDMAIMARIGDCIDKRCKLLGLYKQPEGESGGGTNTVIIYSPGAKPQHVAEERKVIDVEGKTLPPGTSLDKI